MWVPRVTNRRRGFGGGCPANILNETTGENLERCKHALELAACFNKAHGVCVLFFFPTISKHPTVDSPTKGVDCGPAMQLFT